MTTDLFTGSTQGGSLATAVTALYLWLAAVLSSLPTGPCKCSYNFIGNDCCDYDFTCFDVGFGTPVVISDTTEEVTLCVQIIQNCSPCTGAFGGCSGSIAYTDTGSTSYEGGLQAGLNNLLKGLLGATFNVTAQFSAGHTTSTSLIVTVEHTCSGNPAPCQGLMFTQKLRNRTVEFRVPKLGQTFFRTRGIRHGAALPCYQHPEDCPVEASWTHVGTQEFPCETGSSEGTGTDDITGLCHIQPSTSCGAGCIPCGTGPNYNELIRIEVP